MQRTKPTTVTFGIFGEPTEICSEAISERASPVSVHGGGCGNQFHFNVKWPEAFVNRERKRKMVNGRWKHISHWLTWNRNGALAQYTECLANNWQRNICMCLFVFIE